MLSNTLITIKNCFDSHVHWRATGEFAQYLDLKNLKSPQDVARLHVGEENFVGEWLIGFGWDHHAFANGKYPTRHDLDEVFPNVPVLFKRADAHAIWVNSAALNRAQLMSKNIRAPDGGRIEYDTHGWPTGIFVDQAMSLITQHVPKADAQQQRRQLLAAQTTFHRAGFTHIRDLTCDVDQWQAAVELEESSDLKMGVEQFFTVEDSTSFQSAVYLVLQAKKQNLRLLRPKGLKVFFDGALGSEGALLSQPYRSGSGVGLQLLDEQNLFEIMEVCSRKDLDLAVHTIGDEAAARVVTTAHRLKVTGHELRLHLEHAELLRPETIRDLTQLQVHCHMQPCHWLSDKKWLRDKIGELTKYAFPWRALEDQGVPFSFGSDSPIEPTSVQKNFEAMTDAALHQIPPTSHPVSFYHSHPDPSWLPQTETIFVDGRPKRIQFLGESLPAI